jgi:fermentation-respiration switch protein FrsA (DUF1100 family)
MDRRHFLSTTLAATAATAATAMATTESASASTTAGATGVPAARGSARAKRFAEQRWLLDNIIQANGMDWDQARSAYLNGPCGVEANADFAAIRARIKKYDDISTTFEATAKRREARAHLMEEEGSPVSARENYFMAAIHWGAAQWPIDENNDKNRFYNEHKRDCYSRYAKLADHHVEAAWIPYQGKNLPGWFHLPPGYKGGRLPAVVIVPGMDSFKETSVSMYGDAWLNRGFAVLAMEGPGQYECPLLGIYVSIPGWAEAGKAAMDWLVARPEVDPQKIGVRGTSFGSFTATVMAGAEPRYRAVAVAATAVEPGYYTIFDKACPTFKNRFMYMSNIDDEETFQEFRKTLTWEGYADKVRVPYLMVAGEADELSPMEHTERLIKTINGPKRLVVYQESRHSVGGVPSTTQGPPVGSLIADWMLHVLEGKSFPTERWFVDSSGRVNKSAFESKA